MRCSAGHCPEVLLPIDADPHVAMHPCGGQNSTLNLGVKVSVVGLTPTMRSTR